MLAIVCHIPLIDYWWILYNTILYFPADEWTLSDDDKVLPVTSEDVLKLSGGGKEIF